MTKNVRKIVRKSSDMPIFSILVPTYNHEKFIGDCIQSVLSQTFSDWEMIILDDGSTDNTGSIAKARAESDPRIIYVQQPNKGIFRLYETNNSGLEISKGNYISILEGDDLWAKDKLQKQFEVLENNPGVVLCFGKVNAFSSETGQVHTVLPIVGREVPATWSNDPAVSILNALFLDNFIPSVTITIRRSALLEIGGFQSIEGYPATDLPTTLKLATQGQFYFINEILANYRMQSNQITKTYTIQLLEKRIQYVYRFFDSLSPELRSSLTIDKKTMDRHFRKTRLITYVVSGRHKLIRREFTDARSDFVKAVISPAGILPLWRISAAAGWLLGLFHMDMEKLLKAAGRTGYKAG